MIKITTVEQLMDVICNEVSISGKTNKQLSELCDIPEYTISSIKNGRVSKFSTEILLKFMKAMDINMFVQTKD